ncbi:MAG: preprotein translocase subunit YajC [Alphaproteobacteria bacterium]|nr:preprotein translocase subunit YajC [Alphaproteobacteria bacterium]
MISPAFAQQAGAPASDFSFLIIMVGMLAIFYFLLWRPQRKRQKEHEQLVKNLRRGDRVVTAGGLVGTVSKATEEDEVEVEIANGVKVRVVRALVSSVKAKTEPVKAEKPEKPEKKGKKRKQTADETAADEAKTDEAKTDEAPAEDGKAEDVAEAADSKDAAPADQAEPVAAEEANTADTTTDGPAGEKKSS